MKTLHVINGLGTGGAERSLAELLVRLPPKGIEPSIVCLNRRSEGVERSMMDAGVEVLFAAGRSPVNQLGPLRSSIRRRRPDLVHTTIFEADMLGRLASIGGPPVLSSIVNTTYDDQRLNDPRITRWKLRASQAIDALSTRTLAAHLHSITEAVKQATVRDLRIRPEAITVVPRGRDAGRLGTPSPERRARTREALGIPCGAVVALNIGRREYQKGQIHLLNAAHQAQAVRPDLVWLVAGRDGNASAQLADQHRHLALGDTVRFLGHRDDVTDLLVAADLFVFPSLYEGLGGVLLEAMALGVPVVASDIPAVREVLDDGRIGVLVPVADPMTLARAVIDLLADAGQRAAMAAAGVEHFSGKYTLQHMVDGMASLFQQVAAGEAPRP